MANEIQDLGTQVEATVGVEQSAITLIEGFAAFVAAHANDPVALQGFAASLKSSGDALAAAVAANPAPPVE